MGEISPKSIVQKQLPMRACLNTSWDRVISRERELDSLCEHGSKCGQVYPGHGGVPAQIRGFGG